jgi:hypothetical protein
MKSAKKSNSDIEDDLTVVDHRDFENSQKDENEKEQIFDGEIDDEK